MNTGFLAHHAIERRTTAADLARGLDQRAEAQNRRLVEPFRYELYADRQSLCAETKRYGKARQPREVERYRSAHHVRRRHLSAVDDVFLKAVRGRSERNDGAKQHVMSLEIACEHGFQFLDLRFRGNVIG